MITKNYIRKAKLLFFTKLLHLFFLWHFQFFCESSRNYQLLNFCVEQFKIRCPWTIKLNQVYKTNVNSIKRIPARRLKSAHTSLQYQLCNWKLYFSCTSSALNRWKSRIMLLLEPLAFKSTRGNYAEAPDSSQGSITSVLTILHWRTSVISRSYTYISFFV